MIEVHELTCRYGRVLALNAVSFELGGGATGLLGPNGAGKSTLMSALTTVLKPSSGRVSVLGSDISTRSGREDARRRIGWLPQTFALPGTMRILDVVAYSAWCHGIPRRSAGDAAQAALDNVGLGELLTRRVRHLSGGQYQRVGIAAAIAHDPPVLVLDEPTVGLDPGIRIEFRQLIAELAKSRSLLFSTHLVEDIAHTCPRVLVLSRGKLVFDGATEELHVDADGVGGAMSAYERGYLDLIAMSPERG